MKSIRERREDATGGLTAEAARALADAHNWNDQLQDALTTIEEYANQGYYECRIRDEVKRIREFHMDVLRGRGFKCEYREPKGQDGGFWIISWGPFLPFYASKDD